MSEYTLAAIRAAHMTIYQAHIEFDWEAHPHLTEEEAFQVPKIIDDLLDEHKTLAGFNTDSIKEIWDDAHQSIATILREIQAQAWEEGHTAGWQEYHDCYITNTRDPENPADRTTNPHKENK